MSVDAAALREHQALWRSRLAATEALSNRALQREKDGEFNVGYNLCLQAARSYLWLLRNTSDERIKRDLKAQSARLLHRAEKIKQSRPQVQSSPISRTDEFEQSAILDHSSLVRGRIYRQWTTQLPSELLDGLLYSDTAGHFGLSKEQEDALNSFKRISELSKSPTVLSDSANPRQIWQSCVTDCTVITSLISCLHHSQRFKSNICQNLLFPQDRQGNPAYNPKGKYIARLAVNGTWRAVEIDDFLPVDESGSLLCAYMDPINDYWAALIEKAFVKVQGGYRIPGSDPSADVYTFSGWIPEALSLRQRSFRSEQVWKRLCLAFNRGECLITLGSGPQPIVLPNGRELASRHAFSVLSVQEEGTGARIMEIVDPWVTKNADPDVPHMPPMLLDWDFICAHFAALYCNWQPTMFEHQDALHVKCTASDAITLSVQLGPSSNLGQDEVWLLLSKHTDDGVDQEFFTLHVCEDTNSQRTGEDGPRDFTNSPHILLKYRPERTQALLHVTIAKIGPRQYTNFTLSVFGDCPFRISDGGLALPHVKALQGQWDEQSAGGNPTAHTYVNNPHFSLNLDAASKSVDIEATLQTEVALPVNLKLFKRCSGEDGRLQQYETAAIAADSGAYTHRIAALFAYELPAGQYIFVPSTFTAGEQAKFTLKIKSSAALGEVALLPSESSGKFKRMFRSLLSPGSTTCSGDGNFTWQIRYHFSPSQVSKVNLRVRQVPTSSLPVNAAIYASDEQGHPTGSPLSSTGPYASYVAGATTQPCKFRPSLLGYVAVISVLGTRTTEVNQKTSVEVTILSDHAISIKEL